MIRMRGSYALAVMFKEYPGEIYVARKDSPMIIGVQDGECYVASDVPAILKYTRKVYYIGNLEMARLANGEVTFYNVDEEVIEKPLTEIKWDAEAAEKAGFEHFMMKEIHEQPKAVRDTLNSVLVDGKLDMSAVGLSDEDIKKIDQICIVACGSAYRCRRSSAIVNLRTFGTDYRFVPRLASSSVPQTVLSKTSWYHCQPVRETADSLAALRLAKEIGIKTLGIVNVVGSSLPAKLIMFSILWQARKLPLQLPRLTALS